MAISMDLRVLARKLEKNSDDILINASTKGPKAFEKVATAIAAASTLLEGVADEMDQNAEFDITPQQLDDLAALAFEFDKSENPLLKKQASVLDELLLSIAAPKNIVNKSRKATEDEINRLREELRKARREEAYDEPHKAHADMNNAKEQAKAVEQQVKRYRPLEAPLQTRYPPDRPGGQMTRITDHVYQDIVTGIVYDFKAGYKTQKGNEVPGSSVENQTRQLGDYRNQSSSLFETRDSLMGRYANVGDLNHLKKYAMANEIATALKATRNFAPDLLDQAIDKARDDGLSTTEIGEILGDIGSSDEGIESVFGKKHHNLHQHSLTEKESAEEFKNAQKLFQAFVDVGWYDMIISHLETMSGVGVHDKHLSALEKQFLGSDFLSQTPYSAEELNEEVLPFSITEVPPTVVSASKTRQGLIATALGAIQELAPHLLKAAVVKAKAENLTDQQIKSILTANFHTKFKTAAFGEENEIKAAESLLPQLRFLGWNNLANEHLKVMARLGVSPKAIKKLADIRTSSFDELKFVLKQAVFTDPYADFEDEAPQTVAEPMIFEDEPVTVKRPEQVPAQPTDLFTEMFGDFVIEPEQVQKGPITPLDNPAEWARVYAAVKAEIGADSSVKEKITALLIAGKNSEAQKQLKQMVNERMRSQGFAGAYERDPSGVEYVSLAEKAGSPIASTEPMDQPPTPKGKGGKGKRYNWEAYQTTNNIVLSDEKIGELEDRAIAIYNPSQEAYQGIFVKFNFPGSQVPFSYESIPIEIRQKITPMFLSGETSQAVYQVLKVLIEEYVRGNSDDLSQDYVNELEERKEKLLSDYARLDRDGKKKDAESKLSSAEAIDRILRDPQKIQDAAVKAALGKYMISSTDLIAARKALRSSENQTLANELKKKALTGANQTAINRALKEEGLPPLFENVEIITGTDFTRQLLELGKTEATAKQERARAARGLNKQKSTLVHSIPEKEGVRLIPIWEEPERYIDALQMVMEKYPAPKWPGRGASRADIEAWKEDMKEVEAQWDEMLESEGLVGPSRKLFGAGAPWSGTTISMLKGLKLGEVTDPISDFKDDKGNILKNLFSNPDEYAQHYLEGQEKFKNRFMYLKEGVGGNIPVEFSEIHGGIPRTNVSPRIVGTIKKMFEGGMKLDEVKAQIPSSNISEDDIEKIWEMLKSSGKKVRGWILAGLESGKDIEKLEGDIRKKYPDAYIPENIIQYMKKLVDKKIAHNKKVIQEWNDWSKSQGFWPPYYKLIGNVTSVDLLKSKGRRNPDPDVFGGTSMSEMTI
jgi:hypothetical protein